MLHKTLALSPSEHVFIQVNESLFFRRPLLCFFRGWGNFLWYLGHILVVTPVKFSLPVFPLMLSVQSSLLYIFALVFQVQRSYRFGCSLTGCVDEVIHVIQRASLKCFAEKGFCINAQRSLEDLFLISLTAVKISSCKWRRMKFLSYANLLNNLE